MTCKGAIIRLFGVVLIFVGTLDAMLLWRGGLALDSSYTLLICTGVALFALGAVRGSGADRTRNRAVTKDTGP